MKDTGWWPNRKKDVDRWCENHFSLYTTNADYAGVNAPIPQQCIKCPRVWLQIDFVGHLSVTAQNNKYILVALDLLRKNNTAAMTAKLWLKIFSWWGTPHCIGSDLNSCSVWTVRHELCQALGIKRRFHTARHPTSSHLLEHINHTVKEALRKWCKANDKNWDEKLHYFHGIVWI